MLGLDYMAKLFSSLFKTDYRSNYCLKYYCLDYYVQIELLVKVVVIEPRNKENNLCFTLGVLAHSKLIMFYRKKEVARDMVN